MPKDVSKDSPRTVQRHFPPLTNRCIFKPEKLMRRPQMTSQRVFALTEDSTGVPQAPSFATSGNLIVRPTGEVGRPGRNGYSLSETLNWGKDLYTQVQKDMRELASKHLNMDENLTLQNPEQLEKLFKQAKEKHAILDQYQDNWVELDFLTTILKNSSTRKRQKVGDGNKSNAKSNKTTVNKDASTSAH